jgi:hypothetical protein
VGKLKERIESLIDMPSSTQIRNCSSKEEKVLLWEQLKTATFSRALTGLYGIVLLALHLRLQVNVVGRYLHLQTVLNGVSQGEPVFGPETQKRYLAYADHLIHDGMEDVVRVIVHASDTILQKWPLTRAVGYDDILRIILDIRAIIEKQTDRLLANLLPVEKLDHKHTDPKLVMLLSETRNIFESEPFRKMLKVCLDNTFLQLTGDLRCAFEPSPLQQPQNTDVYSACQLIVKPMAKFIPTLSGHLSNVLDATNNEILTSLTFLPQLHKYSLELFKLSN